jgi:hypothetical protein
VIWAVFCSMVRLAGKKKRGEAHPAIILYRRLEREKKVRPLSKSSFVL